MYLKNDLTPTENIVFADLYWFNLSPCCSDVDDELQGVSTL